MNKKVRQIVTFVIFSCVILLFASCNQPYRQIPLPMTNTPISLNSIRMIENIATQTSLAQITPYSTPSLGVTELAATKISLIREYQTLAPQVATLKASPTGNATPQPVTPTINLPDVDWFNIPILGWILGNLKALGGEGLVGTFVGAVAILLIANLKRIFKAFYILIVTIQKLIYKRNKYYAFEQIYLDWLIGQFRYLGLLPAQVAIRRWGDRQQFVNLEKIYTQLTLTDLADDEAWYRNASLDYRWSKTLHPIMLGIKNFLRVLFSLFRGVIEIINAGLSRMTSLKIPARGAETILNTIPFFAEPEYVPGDLGLIVDRTLRLVIKGDPGSGKTTLMRYLALTCARALRNNSMEGDSKSMVWWRLSWRTKPFPIFVRLSRHGNVTNWGDAKSLIDAFKEEMPVDLRRRCPDGFFERILDKRPCLILLDAFDELGNSKARSSMADYMNGFLELYGKEKHRFVVTTRIIGYEGQLDRFGFQSRSIKPLEEGDRRRLINLRYAAFFIVEMLGRTPSEIRAIETEILQRNDALIKSIESTPRLAQLATNPMLLSLITLVHFLKVELPDERILLYRDCVEILTERWQRQKQIEVGWRESTRQDLTLGQKTKILQELAFAMQIQRDQNNSLALLPQKDAILIVADVLSALFGDGARSEKFVKRAEEWVKGVQTDSGILLEQGLDSYGEPLIGFSHLTFQEYLAAVAINENRSYLNNLRNNLLNPAWRELVRLYVVLADDATETINLLLKIEQQPQGLLLAGWCLAERVRRIDQRVQIAVSDELTEEFLRSESNATIEEICKIMEDGMITLGFLPFLLEHLSNPDKQKQVAVIRSLRGVSRLPDQIERVRPMLVDMLDSNNPVASRIAAQETLSLLGDPRFDNLEPIMQTVRSHALDEVKFDILDVFPELKTKLTTFTHKNLHQSWAVLYKFGLKVYAYILLSVILLGELHISDVRYVLQKYYLIWRRYIIQSKNYVDNFDISRYPITNQQYSTFVNETNNPAPSWWRWGICPKDQATHPVTGITYNDAVRYCQWLSKKTGKTYKLPTEWEWETAAGVLTGNLYPWGSEFDKTLCNCKEGGNKDTSPVGTYVDVRSPFGLQDTSGNVHEFIRPFSSVLLIVSALAIPITATCLILISYFLSFLTSSLWNLVSGPTIFLLGLAFFVVVIPGGLEIVLSSIRLLVVAKGGSYLNSHKEYLTSIARTTVLLELSLSNRDRIAYYVFGFRVARYPDRK